MDSEIRFREARQDDVPAIVHMLADDELGATRERPENPLPEPYYAAFLAIDADPNQHLIVATADDAPVGVLQLTFTPTLSHVGSWRAQIEGVRVAASARSTGVGRLMVEEAIRRARARGCRIVQLTTDKRRTRAAKFYERLGFSATHEGMKLHLSGE